MRLPRPEADRSADTSAQVGARNDGGVAPIYLKEIRRGETYC